ncbi:uncharacterized protein ARMOST_08457 [Armillaria ostoyae]|uniref:Uncharacterized protein n=1 Tax=Armillaria ostoyae TaxID=47428 RepID=A0A284R8R7_ARMOS|nr:uncharacterized protein ARMOST_08457 [Armillaria ostoyae]
MEKKDVVVNSAKRKRESDDGAASKRPKLVDHDKVQGDNERMKDKVISKPLPPPTVAPQPAAKQIVTTRRVQGQDSAGEPTTIPKEALKAKASTAKAPVSLFTQVSDEESDSRETPGPDDYTGEIFSDDPQEQVDELVMDAQMAVESDHDPTDVSEVEELLTPSQSKIAVISGATESNIPPSPQNGHRLYPDISQLPSPHLHYKEGPFPSTSSSSGHKLVPNPETTQDHPLTRPLSRPLRKRRPSPDSGFFESPASSPRAPSPQRVRQLPRLIEGPFGGHRLAGTTKRGGPSSDSDSDSDHTETWPPVRGKAKRRLTAMEKGKMKATEEALMEEAAPLKAGSPIAEHVEQVSKDAPPTSRPQQGATNERVGLFSEPDALKGKAAAVSLPPPKESQRMAIVLPKEHPFDVPPSYQWPPFQHTVNRHDSVGKSSLPPPRKGLHFPSVPPNVGSSRLRSSAAPSDDDDEEIVSKLLSDDNPFIVLPILGERPVPFLDLRSIAKKSTQRRYTLAAPPPPHIDLRKEAFKRASRKSLPGTSISAPVPNKDPMTELGKSLVRSWTKRFGLPEESVKKVWQEELSIENTEKRLQRIKHEHEKSLTPTRRAKTKSVPKMDIDMLPDDEDIDGYEPPYSSRARRFAKLSKQGRVKEALDRDRRRASENGVKTESPLRKMSPLWGKAEDKLLRTVNTHNANSLLELEKKVGYAFMLEKVRDVALLNLV